MSGKKIVIIDYEMGNRFSIINSLQFLGYAPVISKETKEIQNADALILPGVGSFNDAMQNIHSLNLETVLQESILTDHKPVFGICLGMQIMAEYGYEGGKSKGLGLLNAQVTAMQKLHVGFNSIEIYKKKPIFTHLEDDTHFYFDHSYHMECEDTYISSKTLFDNQLVTASIQHNNIFATQFHPEKSQRSGLKLLRNFLNYVEQIS